MHVLVHPSWKDPTGSFFRGETHSSWKVESDWLDESNEKVKNYLFIFFFLPQILAGSSSWRLPAGATPIIHPIKSIFCTFLIGCNAWKNVYSNVLFLVLLLNAVSLRQSRSAAFVTTKMSLCRL